MNHAYFLHTHLSFGVFSLAYGLLAYPLLQNPYHLALVLSLFCCWILITETDRLFQDDWVEGRLELWLAEGKDLTSLVLGKLSLYWILGGLPLLFIIAGVLYMSGAKVPFPFLFSLSLGMLNWMATSLIMNGLLLGIRRPVVLILIVMGPLVLPSLMMVLGCYEKSLNGDPALPLLLFQAGLCCLSVGGCLGLTPLVLRWSVR